MAITGSRSNSRAAPARLLKLNLAFKSLCQVDNEKLNEAAAQSDARKDVEIPFGPNTYDLNTTACPDLLGC